MRSSYYYRADPGKLEIVEVLEHPLVDSKRSAAWQHQPRPDPLADESIRNFEIGRRIGEWRSAAREGPIPVHSHAITYMSPMEELNGTPHVMAATGIQMVGMSGKGDAGRHARLRAAERALRIRTLKPSPGRAGLQVSAPGRLERNQASARS